ncbi:MAG: hypothetical protein IPM25_16525 [Chloracidobacterium sp.]|nr:hypothetical protein [Chloracidobacterium sp.]
MLKRYTFWLWVAAVLQLVTAAVHATSLFVQPEPADDTQRQLLALMTTYRIDLGAGFHRSMSDLVTALSSCFSFVCILGGAINVFLLRRQAEAGLVRGITVINIFVFGAIFVVMLVFTFLPPIILTGLITLALGASWVVSKTGENAL